MSAKVTVFCAALLAATAARAATYTVTNLNDLGSGSLRAAVASANSNSGADTIVFQTGLTGTITLTTGELDVTDSVTITGPGSASLTVSGNDQSRIFLFNQYGSSHTHTVSGLTLTHGRPFDSGGGILSSGDTLTLSDVRITYCVAGGDGGGLAFYGPGSLSITNSVFSNNSAENASSCWEFGDVNGGRGGGVYADEASSVSITSSTFSSNGARADGGGLGIVGANSSATSVSITSSSFTSNTADVLGCDPKSGGGIYYGGLGNDDTLTIDDSTIADNLANGGNAGGLLLGDLDTITMRRSTVSGNNASGGYGGGMVLSYNEVTVLENVTISTNTAATNGGSLAVTAPSYSTTLRHTTVTGNGGGTNGGIYASGGTVVTLRNSIAANSVNTTSSTACDDLKNDGTSSFNVTYTLVEQPGVSTITSGGGNILNTDPQLGTLLNNGGTTLTHRPGCCAPVLNAGDPAFSSPPSTDQRLGARVVGGRIDMGSVER
ncbi:MAG TPA: choice-of-anchor Q domain-containing protein [Thermoanaerobaculia bacterium]|nr:choice-of-anchor Q domain-containing protein [Thermoanaerobaculia bacterium]